MEKHFIKLYKECFGELSLIPDFDFPIIPQNYQFDTDKVIISVTEAFRASTKPLLLKEIKSIEKLIKLSYIEIYVEIELAKVISNYNMGNEYCIYCIQLKKDSPLLVGNITYLSDLGIGFKLWNCSKKPVTIFFSDIKCCWAFNTELSRIYNDKLKWEFLEYLQK